MMNSNKQIKFVRLQTLANEQRFKGMVQRHT